MTHYFLHGKTLSRGWGSKHLMRSAMAAHSGDERNLSSACSA